MDSRAPSTSVVSRHSSMMDGLPRLADGSLDLSHPAIEQVLSQHKKDIRRRKKSENTLLSYESDWRHFQEWAERNNLPYLPAPEITIFLYLEYHALIEPLAVSTLRRRMAGIRYHHVYHEQPFPEYPKNENPIQQRLDILARERKEHRKSPKAIPVDLLVDMVESTYVLGKDERKRAMALRDRCILLLGFLGAFRRSEIVGLDTPDITIEGDGLIINLRASKTDQVAKGRSVYIPRVSNTRVCASVAIEQWQGLRNRDAQPLLTNVIAAGKVGKNRLTEDVVNNVVKKYIGRVGEDPTLYSAHSLRSGLATSAAKGGADVRSIMKQTGHVQFETVEGYIQDGTGFTNNAVQYLGL